MAGSLLLVVILIFALRGFFLSVTGVIGRLLGFILGYFIAYQFRGSLATVLSTQLGLELPAMVLQMISGLILFISVVFLTGLVVNAAFKTLGTIIPPLKAVTDKDSTTGKIIGAGLNGSLAAVIGLLLIWGIDQFRQNTPDEFTHNLAWSLGNSIFGEIDPQNWNIQKLTQFSSSVNGSTISTMTQVISQSSSSGSSSSMGSNTLTTSGKTYSTGTATITSANDPAHSLSIETSREVIEQVLENNPQATEQLLQSQEVKAILDNPQLRDQAMQEIQNNLSSGEIAPEQIQQFLNNPQLRQLMEQLSTQQRNNN